MEKEKQLKAGAFLDNINQEFQPNLMKTYKEKINYDIKKLPVWLRRRIKYGYANKEEIQKYVKGSITNKKKDVFIFGYGDKCQCQCYCQEYCQTHALTPCGVHREEYRE